MSGLSGVIGAGAQAGSMLGVQKGGLDPFVFSDTPVDGALTTADMIDQPEGSSARWMFEEAARQHGLDPDAVVKGSPEHQRITCDLNAALAALKEAPGRKGEATRIEALRGAVRDAVTGNGPRLSVAQAATLATMPGAQALSSPGTQAALRAAAAVARHPAAQAGLAVGIAGTIAAGEIMGHGGVTTQDQARAAPFAGLDEAGERREDDTCAPKGTDGAWVVKNQGMSVEARAYQRQIANTPELPGKLMVEYQVTSRTTGDRVDFDGCAFERPDRALLDAKYGYVEVFGHADAGKAWVQKGVIDGLADQAARQAAVTARSHPVEWHVSEPGVVSKMQDQQLRGSEGAPNMTVVHTPATGVAR